MRCARGPRSITAASKAWRILDLLNAWLQNASMMQQICAGARRSAKRAENRRCESFSWLAGGLQSGTLGSPEVQGGCRASGKAGQLLLSCEEGGVAKTQRAKSKQAEKGLRRDMAIGLDKRGTTFGAEKTPQKIVGTRAPWTIGWLVGVQEVER